MGTFIKSSKGPCWCGPLSSDLFNMDQSFASSSSLQ